MSKNKNFELWETPKASLEIKLGTIADDILPNIARSRVEFNFTASYKLNDFLQQTPLESLQSSKEYLEHFRQLINGFFDSKIVELEKPLDVE